MPITITTRMIKNSHLNMLRRLNATSHTYKPEILSAHTTYSKITFT